MKKKLKQKLSYSFLKGVLEKTHKVNLDTMKLLVLDENFQKLVKEIRKKFNVPENGLTGGEIESWWLWLGTQSNKVMDSKSYKEKRKELWDKLERKEFKSRLEFDEADKKFQYNVIPVNAFHKKIKDIAIAYGLPMHFCEHIRGYILYNIVTAPSQNYVIEQDFVNKTIVIKPFCHLSKEEWKLAKTELENRLISAEFEKNKYKHLFKDFHYFFTNKILKPKRKIDRDIEIVEKSRDKGTEIDATVDENIEEKYKYSDRDIMAEIFPNDSPQNLLKIRQVRHRLKKAIKERFPKRHTIGN